MYDKFMRKKREGNLMKKTILYFVLFILFLSGCQDLNIDTTKTLIPTGTITNTPTITKTLVQFPPTWTPTPYLSETPDLSTKTPTPTGTITNTPFILNQPVTLNNQPVTLNNQPVTLTGFGNTNTYNFGLPTGYTKITWKYTGSGNPGYLQYLYESHKSQINYINSTYQIFYNYYNGILGDAVRRGDVILSRQAQRDLASYTDQYNQQIDTENKSYESEIAKFKTTLIVKICQKSTNKISLLISVTDNYTGTTSYQAQNGTDYYLIVETPNQWEITITPKQ